MSGGSVTPLVVLLVVCGVAALLFTGPLYAFLGLIFGAFLSQ